LHTPEAFDNISRFVVLRPEAFMATSPTTRNWKAWQNLQPPGPPRLIVTGEVQTTNDNQTPNLQEHTPQGINEKILLLDLTITTSGTGGAVLGWKPVRFQKNIKPNQYSSVDVLSVAQIKVETVT
jgi:hypothetical protein